MRDNSWIGGDNSFTGGGGGFDGSGFGGGGIAPSNNLMRSRNSGIVPPAGRMNRKLNNPNPNSMAMQRSPNFNGGMNGGMMGGWGGAPSQGAIGNMLSHKVYPGGMPGSGGMKQPPSYDGNPASPTFSGGITGIRNNRDMFGRDMGGIIGPDDQQLQQLLQMFLKRGDVRF